VIVKVAEERCPYCNQQTEIAHIETPGLVVCQCSSCQKVWKIFRNQRQRMIRFKENGPDTEDENLLCPICWRTLEVDYDKWVKFCPDPTCAYSVRLLGLSKQEREIKAKYLELRNIIFECKSEGKIPPDGVTTEYSKLKDMYYKVKRHDTTRQST